MLSAHTEELDDTEAAIDDLFSQLDLSTLSRNSVGIVNCYSEFITNGLLSELSQRLPFDLLGCTTMSSAANGGYGVYTLSLAILTSDDVCFATAFSEPISDEDFDRPIESAYREALAQLPGLPSFIISFFPFLPTLNGPTILKSFDRIAQGTPIYGTLAADTSVSMENALTIHNGQYAQSAVTMLLMHGPANPRFFVTSIPQRNIRSRKAVISEAQNCVLKKANGIPLAEYFHSVGVIIPDKFGLIGVPLMVDYGDGGPPVTVAIYQFNEDGSAACSSDIPQGASFFIGDIDHDGIVGTARITLEQVLREQEVNGVLLFPCVIRYLMLTPDNEGEIRLAGELLLGKFPYLLSYAGGELCPVGAGDRFRNRFHTYTFVACAF
jgi:hypothetical protein